MNNNNHSKLYRLIVNELEESPKTRDRLISGVLKAHGVYSGKNQGFDNKAGLVRGRVGVIINDMLSAKLIGENEYGEYYLVYDKPVIIRIEKCEREILLALTTGPKTKREIRDHLKRAFQTEKTATMKDDDLLSTYMGNILKKLLGLGAIKIGDAGYYLSEKISAKSTDINEMLTLRDEFLFRLHSKGGEFFEHFFLTLTTKYYQKQGKVILESYVTGGSDDGGIDGVIKTEDALGFREITMIQTKNRIQLTNENTVRGFYGAVCARGGTRGIFATVSDFYSTAKSFLDSIDNCIGICGNDIFEMAIKASYGIKKSGQKLYIDEKLLPKP